MKTIFRQRLDLFAWCVARGYLKDASAILVHLLTRTRWTKRRSLLVDKLLTRTEGPHA